MKTKEIRIKKKGNFIVTWDNFLVDVVYSFSFCFPIKQVITSSFFGL